MIENLPKHSELAGLARKQKLAYSTKTVGLKQSEQAITDGWRVIARNSKTIRIAKDKDPLEALADRWWSLLYRLQFTHISGANGAKLQTSLKHNSPISITLGTIGLKNVCISPLIEPLER